MSEWIISIVGVILLGVLLEIVLPEGKTAKYVRGAFSLLIVFAIAAPLPALFKKDFSFTLDSGAVTADETFEQTTYDRYALRLGAAVEEYLRDEGMEADVDVYIEDGKIYRVRVGLSRGDPQSARAAVAKRLGIEESRVEINDG